MVLHHKIIGEGEPLFILHGLFGSLDNWSTLGRQFGEERQVILVDQRNHGHSFHDEVMDYAHMASDLKALMDFLSIEKADLLGHSMGGKTVMQFASQYPDSIRKLMVADIAPWAYESHHDSILKALFSVPLDEVKSRGEAMKHMQEFESHPGVLQFLAKNLYWIEKGQLAWRMNLPVIADHMDNILAEVKVDYAGETLFLRGSASNYIPAERYDRLFESFSDAKVETLEGAGHWLHAEQPEEFYTAIMRFIAG